MALDTTIVWEARPTATAGMANGGGFKPGASGTDFSQQDAAQYNLTSVTTAGIDATLLSASAASNMVGNIAHIISGTNFTVGWYEIISVVAGVSITLDRTCTSAGAGSSGVVNIGGALSFGSTLDDDFMEIVVGGNTIWVKHDGSTDYTLGEGISVASSSGTLTAPVIIEGYRTTRGDRPTGTSRPRFACGTFAFNLNNMMANVKNIRFNGTPTTLLTSPALGGMIENCQAINTSSTVDRVAMQIAAETLALGNDVVSQNGVAIASATGSMIVNNYIHDSNKGVAGAFARNYILVNIFEGNTTADIELSSTTGSSKIISNTIYGSEAKLGIGINLLGATNPLNRIINNIIYGKVTGISVATVEQKTNVSYFNDFFNNTTNATNHTLHSTDITTTPSFTGATQITGTTATTSGSTLTQSGGDFSTVTDVNDYLHVVSGTGVTTGIYQITAHTGTTLTTNNALGTSSGGDVVYFIMTGHNFEVGTNMKATAYQVTNTGIESTSYLDIGAVQRVEPTASAGGGGFGHVS